MEFMDAVAARRSIKTFLPDPVPRDVIEKLLDLAVQVPNHRMTQPWRFYVLGAESRRAYGAALGARKAKKVDDPEAAKAVIDKVADRPRRAPGHDRRGTHVGRQP